MHRIFPNDQLYVIGYNFQSDHCIEPKFCQEILEALIPTGLNFRSHLKLGRRSDDA